MADFVITIETDLSDEEVDKRLQILGELIINKVKDNIRKLNLIQTREYLQYWNAKVLRGELVIESTQEYAKYLEYGTYSYFSDYGLETFPKNVEPKKKDLTRSQAKVLRKGMQPFAPVRRVIYNERIMNDLVAIAFA